MYLPIIIKLLRATCKLFYCKHRVNSLTYGITYNLLFFIYFSSWPTWRCIPMRRDQEWLSRSWKRFFSESLRTTQHSNGAIQDHNQFSNGILNVVELAPHKRKILLTAYAEFFFPVHLLRGFTEKINSSSLRNDILSHKHSLAGLFLLPCCKTLFFY